jgi:predicted esterase
VEAEIAATASARRCPVRVRRRWTSFVLVIVACVGTRSVPPSATRPGPEPAGDALPLGEIDRGELILTMRGRPAGREHFAITRTRDGYRLWSEVQQAAGGAQRLFDVILATDRQWRPRVAVGRDVKDGGTTSTLAGAPLILSTRSTLAPPTTRTASGPVDLFLGDDTFGHFAPTCAIAAPAIRRGFPGMTIAIGGDVSTGLPGITRRTVDLAGAQRMIVTCARGRMLAVEVPSQARSAVRREYVAALASLVLAVPAKPPLPDGLREVERTIDRPDALLACALVVPRDASSPMPAALLLTGSGPQDRDGDSVGPGGIKLGLTRAIAVALAQVGIASLRCDDRGTARSSGVFGAATVPTWIADARAAVALLRREPTIAPSRVMLVGHSEGAVIASAVAAVDPAIAGVALLAGPGRPVDQVLLAQVAWTLARAGLTADEAAAALARHRDAFAAIAADRPLPDTAEAREWSGGEAWLRSHLAREPVSLVARLGRRPVLIAHGAVDQQVATLDADRLAAAARAGGAAVVEHRYPDLDHLFAVSTTGDPAVYADPGRSVDARFLGDLAEFAAAVTAPRH